MSKITFYKENNGISEVDISCNCEFKRYHSFNYLPDYKDKSHPFVEVPYCVNIFDVMDCSRGVELGVFTCVLTRERKICDVEHKDCCCHYKNYLERLKRPKTPTMWNEETKRLEYGIPINYNNWNM